MSWIRGAPRCKRNRDVTAPAQSPSLSTCCRMPHGGPPPVLLFRFVRHLLRAPPRETHLPSSPLMQMLRSPGLAQARGARQARLKCDETEWSEPLRGPGSWLRCARVGAGRGVCRRASGTGSLQYHSEPRATGWGVPPPLVRVPVGKDWRVVWIHPRVLLLVPVSSNLRSLSVCLVWCAIFLNLFEHAEYESVNDKTSRILIWVLFGNTCTPLQL